MSRISEAHFKASQADIQKGTVTVLYSNCREDEFAGIDRGQFYQWADKGFDPLNPPSGIHVAASAVDEANERNAVQPDEPPVDPEYERRQRFLARQKANDEFYKAQAEKRKIEEQRRLQEWRDSGFTPVNVDLR